MLYVCLFVCCTARKCTEGFVCLLFRHNMYFSAGRQCGGGAYNEVGCSKSAVKLSQFPPSPRPPHPPSGQPLKNWTPLTSSLTFCNCYSFFSAIMNRKHKAILTKSFVFLDHLDQIEGFIILQYIALQHNKHCIAS